MGRSNLLGDNFKPYVQEQIKTRQSILGRREKTTDQIVWENGKTAYVALASSINIENEPDNVIYKLPPSVLLSSEFSELRERELRRMQEFYVAENTGNLRIDQEIRTDLKAFEQANEREKRALELPALTNAEAEAFARKFKTSFEFSLSGNTDEALIDSTLEEILTQPRFGQVETAWARLLKSGAIESDYSSIKVGFEKEGWPEGFKNYQGVQGLIDKNLLISPTALKARLEAEAAERAKQAEELNNLNIEGTEVEIETGGGAPVPSGTVTVLGGKFRVDLKNGPTNHAARPLGNWQSDHAWDLFAIPGTPVPSLTSGKVTNVGDNGLDGDKVFGWKLTVVGSNGAPTIFYTHLKNLKVKNGDTVTTGQIIGEVSEWPGHGSEMTHVHIGIEGDTHLATLLDYSLQDVTPGDYPDYEDSFTAVEIGNTGIFMPPQTEPEIEKTIPGKKTGNKRIQDLGLEGTPETYLGNFIARNLVLTNGTTEVQNDGTRVYKAGVADDLSTFNNYAYGFGGDQDWGLVGMPGLISADIKSKNMGSLREATIKIRANSERQFALIDILYCRIGYTMFLEWGHSVYFDNTSTYVSNPIVAGVPSLIPNFLNPGNDACVSINKGFQQQIEDNRRISNGNYDGFFGRVTNFSWSFNPAGYYEVDLKLASIGDIVESLQIDQPTSQTKSVVASSPGASIQPNNTSALAKFLSVAATPTGQSVFYGDRYSIFGDSRSPEVLANSYEGFKRTLQANNTQLFKEESGWWSYLGKPIVETVVLVADYVTSYIILNPLDATLGTNTAFAGDNYLILNAELGSIETKEIKTEGASDYSPTLDYSRPGTSIGKIISARAAFGKDTYSYIRFGDILDFIKEKLLIYNSLCDKEPILNIDTDTFSNFCYYPGSNVSADPSKVMISVNLPVNIGKMNDFAERNAKKEFDGGPAYQKYWDFAILTDKIFQDEKCKLEPFFTTNGFVGNKAGIPAGLIMNIYFEYDYLLNVIEENRDEETKSLKLLDFVNELCKTANSCLGGVNQLTTRILDDQVLQIYDQVSLYGSQLPQEDTTPIINLYGLNDNNGSFVKSFDIKTELTNEFATLVTVGAQANGSKDTTDALALSNWNYGLVDRFIPEKNGKGLGSKPSNTLDNLMTVRDQLFFLWLSYANGRFGEYNYYLDDAARKQFEPTDDNPNPTLEGLDIVREKSIFNFPDFQTERYGEFVKLQQEFFKLLHINSDFNSNQQGMIPINVNVTLDGLSGIRIYDNMRIDTRFIPSYYPQTLFWIIKGVSHKLSGGNWETSLETIAVPKLPEIPSGKTPTSSSKSKVYQTIPLYDLLDNTERDNSLNRGRPTGGSGGGSGGTDNSIPVDGRGIDALKYFIGQKESGNKYEIANTGTAGALSTTTVTDKTIGALLDTYANKSGNEKVFAMGRMQIVPKTLNGVLSRERVKNAGITKNSIFNSQTQEVLFDTLIYDARPNLGNYILGKTAGAESDLLAAVNALGYEWAFAPVGVQSDGKFKKNLREHPNWKGTNYGGSAGNPTQSAYTIKQIAELLIKVRTDITGQAPSFVI